MLPLKDVRVLDLSKVLAGPLCAQYLGDMGAEIVKVEPVGAGDDTRHWPPYDDRGSSAMFMAVNRNKRSLAVDLKTPQGQQVVHRLAQQADVVIQSFGAGTAARLAVDYDTLKVLNPRMVYCEISGYGRTGPLGEEPGYDVMLQAFSGMIDTIGHPDGEAARVSFSPIDLGTGMHAVAGILAGLMQARSTGQGSLVEVSLLDTAMGYMGYMAHNYWATGQAPVRMGTGHPSLCPYQAFDTQDGRLMLGVGNDRIWLKFCHAAGLMEAAQNPMFSTNAERVRHLPQTCAVVQEALMQRTTVQWLALLQAHGVPAAPLHTLDQALAHPHVQERGIVIDGAHPSGAGAARYVAHPVVFNGAARTLSLPPPMLGQHSLEILLELEYPPERIQQLLDAGVVQQSV